MSRNIAMSLRRLAALCFAAIVLAGCAETAGYANSPTVRRCDRNGDIDERQACNRH